MPVSSAEGYSQNPARAIELRSHTGCLKRLVPIICFDVFIPECRAETTQILK